MHCYVHPFSSLNDCGMCHQVIMTLNFLKDVVNDIELLKDVVNDIESTRKSLITS